MLDFAVIGGGPAGINAAIYASRRALKVALFEPGQLGGIISTTPLVQNWLGEKGITGPAIAAKFAEHLAAYPDVQVVAEKVKEVSRDNKGVFTLITEDGNEHKARAVLFATGAGPRKLGAPGEAEFAGKGISYCATCDGPLFKGKRVAVVGGGNTAFTAVLYLADLAKEVYLIHRRKQFRAEDSRIEEAKNRPNVKFFDDNAIVEIRGRKLLERLILDNVKTGKQQELPVDGLFVYIGHNPASALAKKAGCNVDERGYIVANERMETNVAGAYAAGDVRQGSAAQLIAAAADGCVAALAAAEYVKYTKANTSGN